MSLGGGVRFITVRDAHALKDQDQLAELLGPRAKKEELTSVCVFLSKDLDGRKKFSKLLVEKAAVVLCEEIPEQEREAWIGYLAKRKGLELPASVLPRLCTLDPWSLDIIDQELEKLSLLPESMLEFGGAAALPGSDEFLNAFFSRDLAKAMATAEALAERPDESLPLLGLIGWNVRHLAILLAERASGARSSAKLNPYVAEKLGAWARIWSLDETLRLQAALEELDFSLKQRPLLPLGLWDDLIFTFCRAL
jgi:DNA polymerase III delta subunit